MLYRLLILMAAEAALCKCGCALYRLNSGKHQDASALNQFGHLHVWQLRQMRIYCISGQYWMSFCTQMLEQGQASAASLNMLSKPRSNLVKWNVVTSCNKTRVKMMSFLFLSICGNFREDKNCILLCLS